MILVHTCLGEELERELEGHEMNIRYEVNPGAANNLTLVEQNDSSPKPVCRGAKDKRIVAR